MTITKAKLLVRLNLALLVVLYPLLLIALVLDWISAAISWLPRLVVQNIRKIEVEYLTSTLAALGVRVATTPEEVEKAVREITDEKKPEDLN